MTAPAAAPASGPIAPAVPRPAPQAAADPFAFGAVLDLLPGASAKADASTAEEQPGPSNETPQEESSRGQTGRHSLLNDSALLAALPFALRAASTMNERPQAAANSPSLAPPAMKGPKSEDSGASIAAGGNAATVGRLVGERAFHFGASTFAGAIASRTLAVNAPFAPGAASAADLTARAISTAKAPLPPAFRRPRPCRRKPRPTPFRRLQTLRPRRQSLSHRRVPNTSREPHAGGRARGHAQRTKARRLGASPCRAGRDLRRGPRASGIERQGGRRSAARSDLRRAAGSANRPIRRAAVGAFPAGASFQFDGSTSSARPADVAPRASALALAPRPRRRRSARSMSIFRPEASRMSR